VHIEGGGYMTIKWGPELEIGIPVIDSQHARIVEYINIVDEVQHTHNQEQLLNVLNELVDYTLSHFAFEESLMEEAGYPFVKAHSKVHQLFIRRVEDFQTRAVAGEDITTELLTVLKTWLVNHIKRDDKDYSDLVKVNMHDAERRVKAQKGPWFKRLFA
jgi:hemerythrin